MKITEAVFPVAGLGTRMLPATKSVAKELFPLLDKPVIQYDVEEAAAAGIKKMIFITSKGKHSVNGYFKRSLKLEAELRRKGKDELANELKKISSLAKIFYVNQPKPLGLGHAVLMAKNKIRGDYFAVFYPDDVMDCNPPCMKQMCDQFNKNPVAMLAVAQTDEEGLSRYGIMRVEPTTNRRLKKIVDIVEKPGPRKAPSNLAVMGRLILPKKIFKIIEKTRPGYGGEIQMTDAIKTLLKQEPVYAYEFEGERLDAGEVEGYIKATLKLALKNPALKKNLLKYIKTLLK
ncbi:MAG: UTP--glucose-1-phosphate uridylyltransferase [Candidatus Berkelbacteria bacterium]|nr:UTP--glucose-1-phosphate uridylyltransferase [Candidatus Berkelbacteria bacterium]